jgi:hypothetical protein
MVLHRPSELAAFTRHDIFDCGELTIGGGHFLHVLEGIERGGRDSGGPGAILDSVAQVLLAGVHQSAIGVIVSLPHLSLVNSA